MRIHSDTLTLADFDAALQASSLPADGIYLNPIGRHGSRQRTAAWEVALRAPWAADSRDRNGKRRRPPMNHEPNVKGATYDEWGYFLAAVFEIDPAAYVGGWPNYDGRADFDLKTDYAYVSVTA